MHSMQPQLGDRDKITHDRTGKLQDLAVEYFQRAYGLNDSPREDHNELCEEAVADTGCSRRAFRELIYGHSYQAILGPLRDQVPGYKPKLPKREQREQQMAELEQMSLSGGSPPRDDMTITPRPFKLSSAAQPFESPKLLPQPTANAPPKFPSSAPPVVPQSSMVKPKLADRVLASPERHSKSAGASPEPMDLSSYRPGEFSQPEWGSPVMWPTPGETRPQRETPTKPRSVLRADDDAKDATKVAKVAEDKPREEKEKVASEERTRVQEDRVKKEQAEEKERSKPIQEEPKEVKREDEKEELGVIEEALRDKSRARQDKPAKPRTPRPLRSPQLGPALFTSTVQPPAPAAPIAPESNVLVAYVSRIGVNGIALCATLAFCVLRQYVFHLGSYTGRVDLATLLPLLFGSYALLAVLLHGVLSSATKSQQLPMAIAADTEDYVEAWELLHVGGGSRELVHALQQIQLLLESLVNGLDVARAAEQNGVNHSIRLLDYLSSIHKKLAEDIGNTVLVMRLVDSLRRMRMSLLKLCLCSEPTLPLLQPLSASIVCLNVICLLVGVQSGSLLFELLLLPSFVYLFMLLQMLLTYLDSPFSAVAPLNLSALLYIQKRVRNRIAELQAPAE